MYKESIGLVGGFGANATVDFFHRIIQRFASDKEQNLPHVLIDADFTMPSRTRALLWGESYDEVVDDITASIKKMCDYNVEYIVLVCGTAHAFLPHIFENIPEARDKVVDIIEGLNNELVADGIDEVLIIAAEGTLKQKLYENRLAVSCVSPGEELYKDIRFFIEAVKQNAMDEETGLFFRRFLDSFGVREVVLGCTEFPVLIEYLNEHYPGMIDGYRFWDPLEIALNKIAGTIK